MSRAEKWRTVRDAIADLPPPVGTEISDEVAQFDLHFGRSSHNRTLVKSLLEAA